MLEEYLLDLVVETHAEDQVEAAFGLASPVSRQTICSAAARKSVMVVLQGPIAQDVQCENISLHVKLRVSKVQGFSPTALGPQGLV